jgi:hypothetical protein
MQECARSIVITTMLLRCWLQDCYVQKDFLNAISHVCKELMIENQLSAMKMIVRCYALFTNSTSLIMTQKISQYDRQTMNEVIILSHEMFQKLCDAGSLAA